ncbi:hypothetical protein EV356DRAFT_562684 [Viridothelium virens]|uniref:Tetratricopeptide repeat domain-containing protein n=1 Tax=Viridothelium virens TaxID=1048519 RepID=A0A6A6HP54_VIRVR|nr:hypothetical protein EV356DRAFT_562684 [Viridothelium virens]
MVLKTTLYLARQSLAKTFTHGYAQSVVAASQSSYASQNSQFSGFATNVASRLQNNSKNSVHNAFQSQQNPSAHIGHSDYQNDAGLNAYYQAWHKHQHSGDKEWQQFQFAKRIGWKPPSTVPEAKAQGEEPAVAVDQPIQPEAAERGALERSYTESAVDDFKKVVGSGEVEAAAIAKVDEAIAQEISRAQEDRKLAADLESADEEISSPNIIHSPSEQLSAQSTQDVQSVAESTIATSVSDPETYAEQLSNLAKAGHFSQIPTTFEGMLTAGIQPTPSAYNALLSAAVHLPRAKHQVVPKVLDVYSDMLRRRVLPDTATYTILLDVLATRALDVYLMKRGLEEKRVRFGGLEEVGKFMFSSNEAELDILAEDDSLSLAMKVFKTSTTSQHGHTFNANTYGLLVTACAEQGHVEDMVRVYDHMENAKIVPFADIFAPMIQAFAASGDLRSAVECYDEYKALAIRNDAGENSIFRKDEHVYAALIKAYETCGRVEGGRRFLEKVEAGLADPKKLDLLREVVSAKAFVPQMIKNGAFEEALAFSKSHLDAGARATALKEICLTAADKNVESVAKKSFDALDKEEGIDTARSAMALLAMHVRNGDVDAANTYWNILTQSPTRASFLEPTVMHAIAILGSDQAEQALQQSRSMFARLRDVSESKTEMVDQIDEAIGVIGQFLQKNGIVISSSASMELLWTMVENGGLIHPVVDHVFAGLSLEGIARLPWHDVALLTQIQADMVLGNAPKSEIAHEARFTYLLDLVTRNGIPLDDQVCNIVEQAISQMKRSELSPRWQHYRYPLQDQVFFPMVYSPYPPPAPVSSQSASDDYDPYAVTTDNRGSQAITDLLDKTHGRHGAHLNEALSKFRNMRRAGRHPRFFTYGKLISAAAREGRLTLAHEILESAKQDVPFLPHNRVVQYGWHGILDTMVAACLNTGARNEAAHFHQELNEVGGAPSANTFGLYITTLKESTKTFDEATEAVKIFHRAKAEGVEPSSFLYNALIGKLGKARRIDDCLFYFNEMRSLQIRPTSVTYGTIVNALCRVSDEKFAEDLFEEMERMPNYKPRPAPYHSMMQFFLTTKRDRSKVLAYYERMRSKGIQPTPHTYKLLIDTYATLDTINMHEAERVLDQMKSAGEMPEAVHYASLIHAKGCVLHDVEGAKQMFDDVLGDPRIKIQPCLYQALFEAMVANHAVEATEPLLGSMRRRGVTMTPYIANALIHGWALKKDIKRAREVFDAVKRDSREPSTYEAMTRAYLAAEQKENATDVVREALSRGYPAAVANKIAELVGGGHA